jgi:hypothetical protein
MSLVDTIERVRSGLFHIVFFNAAGERVGGGSAFLSHGFLLTNNHVFAGRLKASQVWVRKEGNERSQGWRFSGDEFGKLLVTGSDENSYDYAILRAPEGAVADAHQFELAPAAQKKMGDHETLPCRRPALVS